MDTELTIENVCINVVSVLNGLNVEENQCQAFSPGTKKTVHNNEVSVLSGCP